ncbi:hypothetical protein KMZ32_07510 [Phycicoccus sp. MAQZ13P-2]|uniref:hypothetical protein n=1 Tax=Phycicoccus mangrovi TaxID=2840470 RepID=UPI001C0026B0|nr:hypothetical protein [Phycicoccus mangrovi]MBT9254933.1 hypothetical protein [Phycicoccus mangrovi]MBT9256070.1 hypothetical protein [Phycicoccus mangrovi]MBT9273917.1 hypothetical protein [Phycicoccus mangrovi]
MTVADLSWDDALDAVEGDLARAEHAVRSGDLVDLAEVLGRSPRTTGPLPERLAPRVTAALERTRALEAEIGERMAATVRALGADERRPHTTPVRQTPAYVDARA